MNLLKERFLKTYANIPLEMRDEIILILHQNETAGLKIAPPISWNVAYLEVKNNTASSENILNQLNSLGLI